MSAYVSVDTHSFFCGMAPGLWMVWLQKLSGTIPLSPHLHGALFHLVMNSHALVKESFHRPSDRSLPSCRREGKNFYLYIFIDFFYFKLPPQLFRIIT